MFRLNRGRAIGLVLTGFIIYFLLLSSSNSNTDFRKRTEEGLSRRHGVLQGDLSDEAFQLQTNQKLNEILANKDGQKPLRASDEGTGPAPASPKKNEGDDKFSGVAGRKKAQQQQQQPQNEKEKEKPKYPVDKQAVEKQESVKRPSANNDDDDVEGETPKGKVSADPGKDMAREKLQEYLKKPLVIFSKSYCPHSKRAKHLLLDLYKITPTPLVVELDQLTERVPLPPKPHSNGDNNDDEDDEQANNPAAAPTLGQKLQELLAEISGRRTVPNIMVGTTSIGGNDLIWEMHAEKLLAEKIKELGGKRITGVEAVEEETDAVPGAGRENKVKAAKGHEKRSESKNERKQRRRVRKE